MPVTLKTFDNPIDAHLLKSKLESEGIWCTLYDENTVSINPLYNITVGGIKLVIHESDSERALAVLNSSPSHKADLKRGLIQCPYCSSVRIYHPLITTRANSIKSYCTKLLATLFPKSKFNKKKCKDCNAVF
jgi:uncharacterized protein with PIN domain